MLDRVSFWCPINWEGKVRELYHGLGVKIFYRKYIYILPSLFSLLLSCCCCLPLPWRVKIWSVSFFFFFMNSNTGSLVMIAYLNSGGLFILILLYIIIIDLISCKIWWSMWRRGWTHFVWPYRMQEERSEQLGVSPSCFLFKRIVLTLALFTKIS